MRREEVIALMTDTVIKMNTELGTANGVPSETIKETLANMKPELDKVNAIIFDAMHDSGVINLHS